jgi:hypothetical protein
MGMGTKRQERFKPTTGFVQKNHPFPVTSCGRRRSFTTTENPPKLHSAMKKKGDEPRKGSLSWSELKKGGAVDVWKDAKEKYKAKNQEKKDVVTRATQDVGVNQRRMI